MSDDRTLLDCGCHGVAADFPRPLADGEIHTLSCPRWDATSDTSKHHVLVGSDGAWTVAETADGMPENDEWVDCRALTDAQLIEFWRSAR